jgi:predicted transcriptional regulator
VSRELDNGESKLTSATDIDNTKKGQRRHESALMTAAHILVCLTQEGKSHEEIAREDFDNNLEMVCVWIDYMIGINWMYKDTNDGSNKWIATDNGKKWIEKYYNIRDD